MKCFLSLIISFLFLSCSVFSQKESYIKHTVVKGESILQIAQKYRVTPYDIYRLNPESQNGLKPDSILIIPKSTGQVTVPKVEKLETYEVQPKETLYGISKKLDITIEELIKLNPTIETDGLKEGQIIKVPLQKSNKISEIKSSNVIYHEVQPKETKYSISNKYSITIEQLEKLNPEIVNGLPIGYKLIISNNIPKKEEVPFGVKKTESTKEEVKAVKNNYLNYEVKPKETIFSLCKQFNISQEELLSLNPQLKTGVQEGMVIKVPSLAISSNIKKDFADLTKSIVKKDKKQLVMLLPFNISRIESDTTRSTVARLKKDKFLNMTLDFYSGALMAIDSAKVLGLNVDVKIFDSQETKNSSAVMDLVNSNNFEKSDAVIGPFYQSNVEMLAEILEKNNVPVISPLSKETAKKYNNLYQSMPSPDLFKNAIFDYMKNKNGNIIAIIDPKKGSVKQYIKENQKGVKITNFNEKGVFAADSLRTLMRKDKINYVVLATERTNLILSATNTMISMLNDYQIQMVILEPNETLEFEEIPLSRLTRLKLLFPSLVKENTSPEAHGFENAYKRINKIFPNQFAVRGFDITFDTLLRLSQEKSFEETIQTTRTEQIENKFNYIQTGMEGYTNKGIYIQYYDTDLTIKTAE